MRIVPLGSHRTKTYPRREGLLRHAASGGDWSMGRACALSRSLSSRVGYAGIAKSERPAADAVLRDQGAAAPSAGTRSVYIRPFIARLRVWRFRRSDADEEASLGKRLPDRVHRLSDAVRHHESPEGALARRARSASLECSYTTEVAAWPPAVVRRRAGASGNVLTRRT